MSCGEYLEAIVGLQVDRYGKRKKERQEHGVGWEGCGMEQRREQREERGRSKDLGELLFPAWRNKLYLSFGGKQTFECMYDRSFGFWLLLLD